jgi:hypothetical protein
MKQFSSQVLWVVALSTACNVAASQNIVARANDRVVVTFDFPPQPSNHSGFHIFANFSLRNGTTVLTELFDEFGLLGRTTGAYVFPLFTDPTNVQSGQPYAVDIDFSRLADGAASARLVLTVQNSLPDAFIAFNTVDLFGVGFGNSGTSPGYGAVVTQVSVSPVPEVSAALLTCVGLLCVLGVSASRSSVRRL